MGFSTNGNSSHNADADTQFAWYAVWTRSRQEKAAAAVLARCGVRHYLPLTTEVHQWSDRRQKVEVPLFAGYLFVQINQSKGCRLQVLKAPGVVAFVGNQSGPSPIPDKQIEDVRTALTSGAESSALLIPKEGDRVRVVRGALSGVEGILIRANSGSRLLISIEIIHQSVSVSIAAEDVVRIPPRQDEQPTHGFLNAA